MFYLLNIILLFYVIIHSMISSAHEILHFFKDSLELNNYAQNALFISYISIFSLVLGWEHNISSWVFVKLYPVQLCLYDL